MSIGHDFEGTLSIDRTLRLNLLFDFYSSLLTEKQRELFALYHQADLSLGEIAEQEGVSRQAVHDILKRTEGALAQFEARLKLADAHTRRQAVVDEVDARLRALRHRCAASTLDDVRALVPSLDEICERLLQLGEDGSGNDGD